MVAEHITLYINDDIEFMTPEQFDPPTPQQIERERTTAALMSRWADEYEKSLQPLRDHWLVEEYERAQDS